MLSNLRKTAELRESYNTEKQVYVVQMKLVQKGKRLESKLVKVIITPTATFSGERLKY